MTPERSGIESSESMDRRFEIIKSNIEYLKSHIDQGSKDEDPHLRQKVDAGTAEQEYKAVLYLDEDGRFIEPSPSVPFVSISINKKRDPRNFQRFIYRIDKIIPPSGSYVYKIDEVVPVSSGYSESIKEVVDRTVSEWNSLDSLSQDFGHEMDVKLRTFLGSLLGTGFNEDENVYEFLRGLSPEDASRLLADGNFSKADLEYIQEQMKGEK